MLGPTLPTMPALERVVALPAETLNSVVALLLETAVSANDKLSTKGVITRWHAKVPPPIPAGQYLSRLTQFTPFPRDAVLLSLLYLDRISRIPIVASPPISPAPLLPHFARAEIPTPSNPKKPTPILNSFTLHRLVMSTMLVASKFINDSFVPQARSAKVGGLAAAELVRLEVEVLATLGWELKFELSDLEELSKLLLREGEKAGLVEKSEAEETIAEQESAEVVETEEAAVEEDPNRTPTLPTIPSPQLETPSEPPLPQLGSQLSSSTSSATTSPRLFSPIAPGSTTSTSPVPSPPSSVGGDTIDEASSEEKEEERQLRLKASCETVRRLESLSMSGGTVSNEVVNVC
ncbi:cyclin-domain-containing protein [Leucosporidium creatinivorum]|uniref:Cyclin-domain-containing protein n=1 Tax=Leucosporidium creatinivorum TaxID=106004 RepID=A0A1Y2G080_9BASI|nr:cyclin-domain-containing protein [Leucosporidium creatinivorum]